MSTRRRLKGRRIAVLAADGFEKVELVVPVRALKAAGARVDVVSLRRGRIRGVNLHMPATRVGVDTTVDRADPADYDGLLVPGGFINPDLLRQSGPAREFVRGVRRAAQTHRHPLPRAVGARVGRTPGGTHPHLVAGDPRRPGERGCHLARPGPRPGRQPDHEPGAAGPDGLRPRDARGLLGDLAGTRDSTGPRVRPAAGRTDRLGRRRAAVVAETVGRRRGGHRRGRRRPACPAASGCAEPAPAQPSRRGERPGGPLVGRSSGSVAAPPPTGGSHAGTAAPAAHDDRRQPAPARLAHRPGPAGPPVPAAGPGARSCGGSRRSSCRRRRTTPRSPPSARRRRPGWTS